jgi:hypothetical protein
MLIATRVLTLRTAERNVDVPVRIFAPEEDAGAWRCRYEIDWPEGTYASAGWGADAVQAIVLTLQKIGCDLYVSGYHERGELVWQRPGNGFGFPVPPNARDWLEGEDAVFL